MVIHLNNRDNETEVYYEDNSFNNQGIENGEDTQPQEEQVQIPNQRKGGVFNNARDFAHGFKEGTKNGLNPTGNNPALGVNKQGKKSSNNDNKNKNNNNNKKNPAKGQNNAKNKKNPLPGGGFWNKDKNNKNNNKQNNSGKKSDDKNSKSGNNKNGGILSKVNPMVRKASKQSNNRSSILNKSDKSPNLNNAEKSIIQRAWLAAPIHVKVVIIGLAIIPIILIALISFVGISSGTTAAIVASMCGETEYDVNGADATSFMCSMANPVENADYNVSSLYGWRSFNKSRMHKGIDLAGASGTPILAVHDGEVIDIQTGQCYECGNGYGNYVTIKHNDTFDTHYAHLLEVDVKVGDTVKQGDKIGERGSTGGSDGEHLHFEIRKNGEQISPNPYFGYSDEGYESCLDPDAGYQEKCSIDYSGQSRYIGDDGFNQICGRTGNYSNDGSDDCCGTASTNGSIQDFINVFEGSGGYCDPAKTLYEAYKNKGDRVTIGHGITSDYIPGLKLGDCRSVSEVDAAQMKAIENKRNNIKEIFSGVTLSTFQEDAMTSMAYNGCGDFFDDIAKAAADDDYEEVWNAMKGCTNGGMLGLERRRKAEFALYVTGDYSVAETYKTKKWTTAEYNDFDSDNIIAKKATGTSSECITSSGDKTAVVERALEEYDNWHSSSDRSHYCSNIEKYLASCGYNSGKGGRNNYCAGFATYILKEAGVQDVIGLPNYSCKVTNFKKTTNGTVHNAGGSYVPEPGDLMITRNWGHIVIVEKVEGQRVHYIGGNESGHSYCGYGKVNKGAFDLSSNQITAYISY